MSATTNNKMNLAIHPLKPERWPDFVTLFGKNGACAGCWCMWWRLTHAQWHQQKGEGNKRAIKKLVDSGEIPGLLAYANGRPVGWCALAPREQYPRLAHSRVLKPVDDEPVWSITCFFVARASRRCGITVELLKAAVDFARRHGARIIEGYPSEPKRDQPDAFVYTGLASAFRKAGFKEVARRSPTRPIFRRALKSAATRRETTPQAGTYLSRNDADEFPGSAAASAAVRRALALNLRAADALIGSRSRPPDADDEGVVGCARGGRAPHSNCIVPA